MRSLTTILLLAAATLAGGAVYTLTVSWEPNSEPDLSHYLLYVREGNGSYGASIPLGRDVLTYPLTDLAFGTTYCAALRAVDFAGNESDLSEEACATTLARACGDGILDEGEECDDGNTVGGDGCSSTCLFLSRPEPLAAEELSTGLPYLPQCSIRWVKVTGRGFEFGARVTILDPTVLSLTTRFISAAELHVAVGARSTTPVEAKDLRVTNPDTGTGLLSESDPSLSQSVEVIRNPNFSGSDSIGAEQLNALAIAFGSCDPQRPHDFACTPEAAARYSALVDMDDNGEINRDDLVLFAAFLGQLILACPS